ncbi:unnamed protein product [Wickerhamomyces anomalus]
MNLKPKYFLFLLLTLLQYVAAAPKKTEALGYRWKYIVFTCKSASSYYTFGTNLTAYYTSLCGYEPITGTVVNCMANELGPDSNLFQKSLKRLANTCTLYGGHNYTADQLESLYKNTTENLIDLSTVTTNLTTTVFYQPVNVTHEMIQSSLTYYEYLYFNFDQGSMLAGIMYLFFVLVFIIIGSVNFIKRLGLHRHFNNKFINWYRAKISIPALFNGKHTEAPTALKVFSTLIPTRVESIVIFFFLCLNILLSTAHYSFKSTEEVRNVQLMEFVADRTGLLSFGLIPLLIIFAGRNNILTTLTGIPYSTFIVFHKWVARFMWIHALIHSACWTAYAVYYKVMAKDSAEPYWTWGIVATILGGLILVQAFHIFRNMAYETFLFIHIVLAILFIVGCWWHCYTLGWLEWIYVSWAVWIFDRVLRVVKMCMFGFRNAQIELIADDTFKITVKHVLNKDETTIYVKTKAGITNRLNKQLAKIPGNKKTIRISIEGPYGHRAPIEKYDTALLLAGGNGIPGPYYHAIELSKRESSTKQQIKLTWIIRNPDALQWFHKELEVLAHTNVQTDIYITAQDQNKEKLEVNVEEKKDASSDEEGKVSNSDSTSDKAPSTSEVISSLSNHINFHYGRPNLEEIIVKEFTDEKGPSVAVMSCGPPKMVDAIRNLVAKHLQESKGRVDLYEELQVW